MPQLAQEHLDPPRGAGKSLKTFGIFGFPSDSKMNEWMEARETVVLRLTFFEFYVLDFDFSLVFSFKMYFYFSYRKDFHQCLLFLCLFLLMMTLTANFSK